MSGTRREVELVMRVQDLSTADFNKISASVKELTTTLGKQIAEAGKGANVIGELRSSVEQLKQAGEGLKAQSSLFDRYAELNKTLGQQRDALEQARQAQESYTPVIKKNGDETQASAKRQESLQRAVDQVSTAMAKTQTALASVSGALTAAGIDTNKLAASQEALRSVAGQVGQAQTAASASMLAYAGNVRKAREETAALAAAEKARAGGAAPGFISPNTAQAAAAAAPGFVSPSISTGTRSSPGFIRPPDVQNSSQANQTGLFGLRAYEVQNLGYQINDVFTQLASGTRATQVAAQQGGQVLQIFNRNLFDLLPYLPRIAGGLAVVGVAFVAVSRAIDISASTRQFNADLTATVEGTRYAADTLTKQRKAIQDYGVAWDEAGALIQKAVEVGLNPDRIVQFAKVAQDLSDRTGAKFPEVADNLIKVFTGPFEGIVKLNAQYGFWTQAQIEANRELAESGRLSEAQAAGFSAFRERQAEAAKNVGVFTKTLREAKTVWRELLDISAESFSAGFAPEIAGITETWKALANVIHYAADGVRRYREGSTSLPGAPATDQGRGPGLGTAGIPLDLQPIISQAAALAKVNADQIGQLYRNEAVRNSDGSFRLGQPNHTGELAEGAFQVLPSTFNTLRVQFKNLFDQLAADIKKPVDIKTNEFNALAGSLYYMQQLRTYQDPGRAAGAYFAGPENFDLYEQGRTNPKATKAIKEYIDKFLAGLGGQVAPVVTSSTAAGDRAAVVAAGVEPSGTEPIATSQAKVAAGAKLLDDLRNQLIVTRALRDEQTDLVRINEAGKKAVEGVSEATDGQLQAMRKTAEETERSKIAAERYAFAQKEAVETVRSGANAARDKAAFERGVAEALANGIRTQQELDAAGDRARTEERAKRLKAEQEILDIESQQARLARFKEFGSEVIAAGQAKVNELTAKGITTIETLRAARNQAEDEAFARLQRNKELQNQGDSLQTQLASLTRGDLKSPLQELNVQLQAVEAGYAALLRRVEQFKSAGGTTIGKGPTAVGVDAFEAEIAKAKERTIALTTLKNAEDSVNKVVQERGILVKTVDDLVARGAISTGEGERLKQSAYADTNKELLPAVDTWARLTEAAAAAGTVSGATLDVMRAKIRQVRTETELIDPLTKKLQDAIPEAFGSAVVRGVETVATAIGNLANGTGKLTDVFKAFGTGALQVLADVAKVIGETIIKYEVMQAISSATSGSGGNAGSWIGRILGLATAAAGGSEAGIDTTSTFVHHRGGIVGIQGQTRLVPSELFRNAPRYHSGGLPGLASNERTAIVETGEEILRRDNPRHIMNGGGQSESSIRNILLFDEKDIPEAMANSHGERVVIQHIKRNATALRQLFATR